MVFSKHIWLCAIKSSPFPDGQQVFNLEFTPTRDRSNCIQYYNNNKDKDLNHDPSLIYFEIYFSCVFNLLLLINRC